MVVAVVIMLKKEYNAIKEYKVEDVNLEGIKKLLLSEIFFQNKQKATDL